jgi:hypothetical protein
VCCYNVRLLCVTGECERFVTSLKTNKHLIELDLCENLIGTAEVCCSTFLILEVFLFSQFRRSRQRTAMSSAASG